MQNKNKVWFIITWLLTNENEVTILDFRLHTIPFCPDKKTIFNITCPNKCDCYRHFFLRIFINDLLSFISTLCETIDRKLNNIIQLIFYIFSQKSISTIIFDKIPSKNELIELIQNSLWMRSSDLICNFSEGKSFLFSILLKKCDQSSL